MRKSKRNAHNQSADVEQRMQQRFNYVLAELMDEWYPYPDLLGENPREAAYYTLRYVTNQHNSTPEEEAVYARIVDDWFAGFYP